MNQPLFNNEFSPWAFNQKATLDKLIRVQGLDSFGSRLSNILLSKGYFYSFRIRLRWSIKSKKNFVFIALDKKELDKNNKHESFLIKTPTRMDAHLVSGKKNPVSGDSGSLGQEILSGYEPTMQKLKLLPTAQTQGLKVCKDRRSVPIDLKLLPTPNVSDSNTAVDPGVYQKRKEKHAAKGVNLQFQLRDMARQGLLPTPLTGDYKPADKIDNTKQGSENLRTYVLNEIVNELLPTPVFTDNPSKNTGKRHQDGLQKRAFEMTGVTNSLNPEFVQEMMGFPDSWILKPFIDDKNEH